MHLIWTPVPPTVTLLPKQAKARWGFILVVANSLDAAETFYDEGLSLMATGDLLPSHEKAWKELWLQSKVEVTGSDSLCRALIGCLFYLLSAFPSIHDTSSSFGGVSPGGLSNGGDGQDYWGHVFWDQVGLLGAHVSVSFLVACLTQRLLDAGHLDVSRDSVVLPQAGPSRAGVQSGDCRRCERQRPEARLRGTMLQ